MTFAAADVNRLIDNARVRLPGALDGAIQLELFNVLNDFFQSTNIWTEDVAFNVTAANTKGTTIEVEPSEGTINRLLYVWNGDNIQRSMGMSIPGELVFIDVPNGAETWTVRFALTVTDPIPASGRLAGYPLAPSWILAKYSNGILDGLLARMMMQIAKPYSNPKMATMHARYYAQTVARAKAEARKMNTFGTQNWRFPRGFATSTLPSGGGTVGF